MQPDFPTAGISLRGVCYERGRGGGNDAGKRGKKKARESLHSLSIDRRWGSQERESCVSENFCPRRDEGGNYSLRSAEFSQAITRTLGRTVDNRAGDKILPENMLFGDPSRGSFFRSSCYFASWYSRESYRIEIWARHYPTNSIELEGHSAGCNLTLLLFRLVKFARIVPNRNLGMALSYKFVQTWRILRAGCNLTFWYHKGYLIFSSYWIIPLKRTS